MSKRLGIFLNNTDSNVKIETNFSNYNKLKDNFTAIYILDIDNNFSNILKDRLSLETKIINYDINNKIHSDNTETLDVTRSLYVLSIINYEKYEKYDYITFINDSFIYLNSLKEYFKYVDKHKLDFCAYSDSTEYEYHYQLYFVTISSIKIPEYIKYYQNDDENNNNINYNIKNRNLIDVFKNKMVYLKLGYVKSNLNTNIFYNNDKLYEFLVENNFLPIINIHKLRVLKDNYSFKVFKQIPYNFDLETYRSHEDLKTFPDDFLIEHFINYGQYEMRIYSKKQDCNLFILPNFIRKNLNDNNLLLFFDIPYDFNLIKYKELNTDLTEMSNEKLIIHYMNFGMHEGRKYS